MIRKVSNAALFLATLSVLLLSSAGVQASSVFSVCSNPAASGSTLCSQSNTTTNPLTGANGTLLVVANVIALIAGVAAVIVIIISGLRFVTSGGDPSRAQGARSSLIYALAGLVVIALADTILSFVLSRI